MGESESLAERNARIYLYYIREEHTHFTEIAKEFDEEYSKKA